MTGRIVLDTLAFRKFAPGSAEEVIPLDDEAISKPPRFEDLDMESNPGRNVRHAKSRTQINTSSNRNVNFSY